MSRESGVMGLRDKGWLPPALGLLAVAALPYALAGSANLINLAILVGIYYTVCIGLSLIFGVGGQLSLAQAAFYGIGAYSSAVLATKFQVPVVLGFVAAGVISGAVGWVLAAPILRLRTVYLAMATLAFGDIVVTIIRENPDITGGSTGIVNLPPPAIGGFVFDTPTSYYYFVWAVAIVAAWIAHNIISSRIGLGLRAIGDSEIGAASCGVEVARYKTWMFTIGAVFAGLAGALFVHYLSFISPDSFTVDFSILMVLILAVGGKDSLVGALLGAVFVVVLPILLAGYEQYSRLVFGALFLGCVMFMPRGITGELDALFARGLFARFRLSGQARMRSERQ
jgi:branched-chain amino acid transport system permease protein